MRYALGRQTYAPSVVVDNIKNNIDLLPIYTLKALIKEIQEQESYGLESLGMNCDIKTWLGFKKYLQDRIELLER